MNLRQLQYAVLLAETRSFSHLAERLSISQPALSKRIIALENELGVKLFNRDTVPLTLTPAGEYYVRQAKDLLERENRLRRSMEQFRSGEAGRLTIGISPYRSSYLIPEVVRKVREKYPQVQIVLEETNSDALRVAAAEGKYDFAIVNLPVDDTMLDVIPLAPEPLMLAVPNCYLDRMDPPAKQGDAVELRSCAKIPFVSVSPTQEMGRLFDRLCTEAGFVPEISVEVRGGLMAMCSLACEGLGAAILPLRLARNQVKNHDVTLLPLKEKTEARQMVVVAKKGQYRTEYAQYAVDLLKG